MKYGIDAVKSFVPSIASSFLKIPAVIVTYIPAQLLSWLLSRKHEQEADDAIPDRYVAETADFLEAHELSHRTSQNSILKEKLKQWTASHPSVEERIETLRRRATINKA